jgi:hypothetical protein
MLYHLPGEVSEWPNVQAWKVCVPERVPWVRIPPSPQMKDEPPERALFFEGMNQAALEFSHAKNKVTQSVRAHVSFDAPTIGIAFFCNPTFCAECIK